MNHQINIKRIGIVTPPLPKAGITPLSNLATILTSLYNDTYLITGNDGINISCKCNDKIHITCINYIPIKNPILNIFNHIYLQFKLSYYIFKHAKNVDAWIFFLDSQAFILPVIASKITLKKTIFMLTSSLTQSIDSRINFTKVWIYSEKINFIFADKIILYSKNLINTWRLEKYYNKILIAHEHILDFNNFKISKSIEKRKNIVGFIGRFSEEKGIINFVNSIPIVLKAREDVEFWIVGDGKLLYDVQALIDKYNINKYVSLFGWIPHDELPKYLNELKLIVIPSNSEGLPNIMIEAMACGTPILATPVGSIPDIITDGKNGYLMENNSSDQIAKNIIKILDNQNIDDIIINAKNYVILEFSINKVKQNFEIIKQIF